MSSTVHKNRLVCLSSDFSHHYALNKGGNSSNWGSKLVLLIEDQLILVRVQYPVSLILKRYLGWVLVWVSYPQ